MGVELLCDAFVLHHQVLPERGTGELHMQLALANEDLLGIAANGRAHHIRPGLHNAVFKQGRLQALLSQKDQQGIMQRLRI